MASRTGRRTSDGVVAVPPNVKRPNRIKLGNVLRATEPDFALVECFTADNNCLITPHCRLRVALGEALAAFCETLDRYTLEDLLLISASRLRKRYGPRRLKASG